MYLVIPRLTSALQSRPFSSFKVLPPVCRVFRVSWRCLRRKMMNSFIQTAYVVEDLAVLKIPNLERDVERSAKLEGRKSLPSPVDWPKMNEGGCTGPENELRRKGLSAACCWMRSSACSGERLDACKFGRASFEVLVSSSCRPIEENS